MRVMAPWNSEPTDLIYEGIATTGLVDLGTVSNQGEPTDLIYEGIATPACGGRCVVVFTSRMNQPT